MQNVGTVVAIKRAVIDGQPLIERVVTVTGESIASPGNFWTRLGTPVQHLLQQTGFTPATEQMVIMGGPLMGFTLPDLNAPVVKICNCLLVPSIEEVGQKPLEEACIRCGLCVDACPAALLPQQLYWFSKGKEHEKAQKHNLFDCIECGACAYVCQVIFHSCNITDKKKQKYVRLSKRNDGQQKQNYVLKRNSSGWNAKNWPEKNAIKNQLFKWRHPIKMLLPQPLLV